MKKSMVLVLITLMIISVFMISCNSDISDNSSGGDKLVKVVFSTENTGSKGISATPVQAAGPDTLFWYYKASKADSSLYRTGETVALGSDGNNGAGGWKAVNPDDNGNAQAGFATSGDATYQSLKYFSEGAWVFSFRAYSSAVDWNTTSKDQAYITEGSQSTNLEPVYYQDNLSASITSTTIASDGKYHITISPTAGNLGNAVLVFPTTTTNLLNWKYIDDGNGASEATITALSGHSAVMKVFYTTDTAITSSTQWTELAISTNDNEISDGEVAFDDFVSWDGETTNGEVITLESSVAGIDYKLKFEVWSTDLADKDVKLGSFTLESATAYLGGKIELAIASGSTYAVTDNESQFEAVITDVNPVAVVVQATTSSATATSATATIVAPAAPAVELTSDESQVVASTPSPALKIESSVSATSTAQSTTGVSIPEGGLVSTTTTATYTENNLTTTVTTSSSHSITVDVKNDESDDVAVAEFAIVVGEDTISSNNVVTLAGVDFTLTKTTTTTTTTYEDGVVISNTAVDSTPVDPSVKDFNGKYTTVYATIKPNQTGVRVLYSGIDNAAQPVFNASNTNPSIAAAEADSTSSAVGTGYNPTTGLIVFKTNHFSQFYVTATPVASVTRNEVVTKYGTLEEAFAAADDNDTVTLLSDVTVSKATANAKGLFTLTKSITIDGNSKKINATNTTPGGGYFLNFNGEASAFSTSVHDLTINSTGYQVAVLTNCDYVSTLEMEDVNITCDGECIYSNGHCSVTASECEFTHQGLYASGKDPVYYSAIIVGYGGDIELENCTITSFGNGIATFPTGGSVVASNCGVSINEDASSNENAGYVIWARNEDYKTYPEYCKNSGITIVSGTYTGNIKVSQKNEHGASGPSLISKITIQGGTFIGDIEPLHNMGSYSNGNLADHIFISGGTFSTDPTAYLEDGCIAHQNSDGTWTVEGPFVASLTKSGGTSPVSYHMSIQEAIDAAEADDTVTLLRNVDDLTTMIRLNKSLTINGNEFTVGTSKTVAVSETESDQSDWEFISGNKFILWANGSNGNTIKVTMKNITFESEVRGLMFEEYCNADLEDVTIDSKTGALWVGDGAPGSVKVSAVSCNISCSTELGVFDRPYNVGKWPYGAVLACEGAEVNIKGGSIEGYYGIYIMSSGGTVNVTDEPTVTGVSICLFADYSSNIEGIINVYSGTFNNAVIGGQNNGSCPVESKLNIYGGVFNGWSTSGSASDNVGCYVKINITNGSFTSKPDDKYVATNHLAKQEDNMWVIVSSI